MIEIECPKCHTVFEEDESKFASIVQQVRDKEFHKELEAQVATIKAAHASELEAALAKAAGDARDEASAKDEEIASLKAQMEAMAKQQELEVETRLAEARREADVLREQVKQEQSAAESKVREALSKAALESERERAEVERTASERAARIQSLEQELASTKESFAKDRALAVSEVRQQLEGERDRFRHEAELARKDNEQLKQAAEAQRAEAARNLETIISEKDKEIENIKNLRVQQTVKMVGEELEQHCETEFNLMRNAFPNATFEKDNTVEEGTKGDYIFRAYDEDGTEYLSIMFEMKNEEDGSTHKKRNRDHFDKLDRDRTKKNCEYAVLVSTLEKDDKFYNQGIVDVSLQSGHDLMYVIRPQFFIPLLSILSTTAKSSVKYRRKVRQLESESIDISYFNQALGEFKTGFGRDYEHASAKLNDAMDGIDKAIKQLEKIKESFRLTETHLTRANKKAEELTIKRLTKRSPMLAERFEALPEQDSSPVEPDQVEGPDDDASDAPADAPTDACD